MRRSLLFRTGALLVLAFAGAQPSGARAHADGPVPAVKPPTVGFGMPTPDGVALWRHAGANRPEDRDGVTWTLERVGGRTFHGRAVDVLRYVARDAEGRAVERTTWDQADFVDPATGEVVGGLDGWGRESYAPESDEPRPCPGR